MVDRTRDELLAGAGLPGHEHGDVDARRLTKDLTRLQHLGAAPELDLASDAPGHLLGRRPTRRQRTGIRGPGEIPKVRAASLRRLQPRVLVARSSRRLGGAYLLGTSGGESGANGIPTGFGAHADDDVNDLSQKYLSGSMQLDSRRSADTGNPGPTVK